MRIGRVQFDRYDITMGLVALVCFVFVAYLCWPAQLEKLNKTKAEIICAGTNSDNCIGPQ